MICTHDVPDDVVGTDVAGAALNDAGLAGGDEPTGRPLAEFISQNPQDSEIAAIP